MKKNPGVGIKLGLIATVNVSVPEIKPREAILALPQGKLINRLDEQAFIRQFLSSNSSVLWITGMPGVGKSVLTSEVLSSQCNLFSGMGVLRVTESTSETEILKFFNDTFLSIGNKGVSIFIWKF